MINQYIFVIFEMYNFVFSIEQLNNNCLKISTCDEMLNPNVMSFEHNTIINRIYDLYDLSNIFKQNDINYNLFDNYIIINNYSLEFIINIIKNEMDKVLFVIL